MMAPARWRRAFRFSLGGLLFVTLCTCMYLGSHRLGEQTGAQDQFDESFYVKAYNIDDLLIEAPSDAERDKFSAEAIAWIRSTVCPHGWTTQGPQPCEIRQLTSNSSLIVAQFGAAHKGIPAALKELRRRKLEKSTQQALGLIESLAEHPAEQLVVLVSYPQPSPQAHNAVANRFADLSDELTRRWGAPKFTGACTDQDFPAWSPAQSLAAWPCGNGQIYLAVQDRPKIGRAVVAGWLADK